MVSTVLCQSTPHRTVMVRTVLGQSTSHRTVMIRTVLCQSTPHRTVMFRTVLCQSTPQLLFSTLQAATCQSISVKVASVLSAVLELRHAERHGKACERFFPAFFATDPSHSQYMTGSVPARGGSGVLWQSVLQARP
jgi:hypothetical protein